MIEKFLFLYLITTIISMNSIQSEDYDMYEDYEEEYDSYEYDEYDDEYYCKQTKEYRVCRRSHNIEEEEEQEEDCVCDNIALRYEADPNEAGHTTGFTGGSDCFNAKGGEEFCFINMKSVCNDKKYSQWANLESFNLWHNTPVYTSSEACQKKQRDEVGSYSTTGNEKVLFGIKLTKDYLVSESGDIVQFSFSGREKRSGDDDIDYDAYDDNDSGQSGYRLCQLQCEARPGECGAWGYDQFNEICHLHNINSCCGQREKHEENQDYISGYVCNVCWSTRKDCPCSVIERQGARNTTAHTVEGGGERPLTTSAVSLLRVDKTILNRDVCACKPRFIARRRKWKCFKPRCSEKSDECQDIRRCRPWKIDL